jgi:hypothetical protein
MSFTMQTTVMLPTDPIMVEKASMELIRECKLRTARNGNIVEDITVEYIDQRRNVTEKDWETVDSSPESSVTGLESGYEYRLLIRAVVSCVKSSMVMVICRPYDIDNATLYAQALWPDHTGTIYTITSQLALTRVHGWRSVPYTIYDFPLNRLHWYRDIAYHERAGRIVMVEGKPLPDTDPVSTARREAVDVQSAN